jgi:hypothetical protein
MRAAPRFDKSMGFFERVLFQGGREWVCSLDHLKTQAFEVERFERRRWGIVERAAARKTA